MAPRDINIGGVIFHIGEDVEAIIVPFLNKVDRMTRDNLSERKLCHDFIAEILIPRLSAEKQVISLKDATEMITQVTTQLHFFDQNQEKKTDHSTKHLIENLTRSMTHSLAPLKAFLF